MFTENVLTWLSLILAIRFSVNRLLYFWQWTSFRLDYKKQTLMLMSKSHLFLYFLLCHFFKSSLKLLNLVISRAIFSGCELAAGQARKEIIISNFNLVVRRLQIRAFSLCLLLHAVAIWLGKWSSESSQFSGVWTDRTNDFPLDAVKSSFVDV